MYVSKSNRQRIKKCACYWKSLDAVHRRHTAHGVAYPEDAREVEEMRQYGTLQTENSSLRVMLPMDERYRTFRDYLSIAEYAINGVDQALNS